MNNMHHSYILQNLILGKYQAFTAFRSTRAELKPVDPILQTSSASDIILIAFYYSFCMQ